MRRKGLGKSTGFARLPAPLAAAFRVGHRCSVRLTPPSLLPAADKTFIDAFECNSLSPLGVRRYKIDHRQAIRRCRMGVGLMAMSRRALLGIRCYRGGSRRRFWRGLRLPQRSARSGSSRTPAENGPICCSSCSTMWVSPISGRYGSEIQTPAIDSLAQQGVRFSNFHSAPMCSPTRASLLTGRNPHAAGVGTIADWADARPGYQGAVRPGEMLPALLQKEGYGCYAEPGMASHAAKRKKGRPARSKTGRHGGGLIAGMASTVRRPTSGILSFSKARRRSRWLARPVIICQRTSSTGWFRMSAIMWAVRPNGRSSAIWRSGGCHWPLQAPEAFIKKSEGRYDGGWGDLRRLRFERQKQLGIVPCSSASAPRQS